MRRSLWQILVESFAAVYGLVSGIVGLLLTIVFYIAVPSNDVIVRILVSGVVLLVAVSAIAISTLLHALVQLSRRGWLPQIRAGRSPFEGTSAILVCVAEPSELFYTGIWVSFYRTTDEDIELPIGIGSVVNVQEDGKILLEMTKVLKEHKDYAERVRNNEGTAVRNMLVKPYVPQQMFGSYEEQG